MPIEAAVRYNEIDAHAAAWLRNLISLGELPDGDVDERSIVDVRGDDLAGCDDVHFFAGIGVWARAVAEAEAATGHRLARPLATGSCPCQPLSAAGQRKGHIDERHLWPAFHRLIAERRFATVLGEQVASKDGREWMAAVRHDLEASGYAVGTAILPAGGFGAPHIRYRMFFVAHARVDGPQGRLPGRPDQERRDGAAGGLADAGRGGRPLERASRLHDQGQRRDDAAGRGEAGWPGPADSFWTDADWVFCRDGKWRPIEPQSFPLVDGSAFDLGSGSPYEGMSRAGMLRGYGNALVLPVARAFVECAMEALDAH
jgi:DNA (cytosine-5)-methyltransferase 1